MNMEESSKEQQSLDEAVLHEPPEVHLLSLKNSDEGKKRMSDMFKNQN